MLPTMCLSNVEGEKNNQNDITSMSCVRNMCRYTEVTKVLNRVSFFYDPVLHALSPCLLVDLGRPVHGLFSIFFHGSNLLKNLDTADRLNPMPICKRSIQRRLSNLWLSQENCCEKTDDFVENRKNRVRWCRNRLHWTLQEQWNRFLFSLIHPDVCEIPAVFSHGSSLFFF
jgi:hypothetical protein